MTEPKVKTSKLAEILGVEASEIKDLLKSGHLKEAGQGNLELGPSIRGYIEYLNGSADVRQLNEQLLRERVEKTRAEKEKIKAANKANKNLPVAADSLISLSLLSKITATDKADSKTTLVENKISSIPGPRGADLYPLVTACRVLVARKGKTATVQQSIIERNMEDARLKRLHAEKMEGTLANVDELNAANAELFEGMAAIIRTSDLTDSRKGDIFTAISDHLTSWAAQFSE